MKECVVIWGDVEIDHIVPTVKAESEEEIRNLNHLSNLQLLSKEDNRKKYVNEDTKEN